MPLPCSAAIAADRPPPSANLGRTTRRNPAFTCDTASPERSVGIGSRRIANTVSDWDETANGAMGDWREPRWSPANSGDPKGETSVGRERVNKGDWELVDERRFVYERLSRADWRETRQTEPAAGSAAQR